MSAGTFERFVRAAEQAAQQGAHEGDMTDLGVQHALANLREAEPVARAIALLGNPLDNVSEPLELFRDRKRKEAIASNPPDPEGDASAAEHDAVFYTGLALGLLLADRV
ncbi:MAG TPA: hypothetical protein VM364_05865 [Vicinamibacterales bacterium]|nr:hypothetical protein [Vicinamibacterales bacterium]